MNEVISLMKKEKMLAYTGFLGLGLGGICQVYIMIFGAKIGLEGDLTKAVSFDVALGIFMITTAIIVSFAKLPSKSLNRFRWIFSLAAIYSYGLETIQHFRGFDPRFSQAGGLIDVILGGSFAIVAITMIGFYIRLAFQFFRKDSMRTDRFKVILGIRYGLFSTMLAFAAGVWIILLQSRFTGEAGNIIWLRGSFIISNR